MVDEGEERRPTAKAFLSSSISPRSRVYIRISGTSFAEPHENPKWGVSVGLGCGRRGRLTWIRNTESWGASPSPLGLGFGWGYRSCTGKVRKQPDFPFHPASQEEKSVVSGCDGISSCTFVSDNALFLSAFDGLLELWDLQCGCR